MSSNPPPTRRALHPGHEGLLDTPDHLVGVRDHRIERLDLLRGGALLGELRDVVAGTKRPISGPGEDDDPDRRIGGQVVEGCGEALPCGEGHRVAAFRAIDDHPRHVPVALDQDLLRIVHRIPSSGAARTLPGGAIASVRRNRFS